MAVRCLPGGELPRQQAQGAGGGLGTGAAAGQVLRHGAAAVPQGEGQGVPELLEKLTPGQKTDAGLGDQSDMLGKNRGAGNGEITVLVAVTHHPQQHGAPGGGGDGLAGAEVLGVHPAPADGTGYGGACPVRRPRRGVGAGSRFRRFSARQPHQQYRRVGIGSRGIQGIVPPDNAQCGQSICRTEGLALQGRGGGDGSAQQKQRAEQRANMFFHKLLRTFWKGCAAKAPKFGQKNRERYL